jgi:hypothetical protein
MFGRHAPAFVPASLALLVTAAQIGAHSWYDRGCCDDRHCAPIPAETVTGQQGGYGLNLQHDDHFMLKERGGFRTIVPYDSPILRRSLDDQWHACLVPKGQYGLGLELRCLYLPGGAA